LGDPQREWQQQSLRDVRALLDKEEAQQRKQKRTVWILAFSLLPLIGLLAMVVLREPPAESRVAEQGRVACESGVWARLSGERERDIRAANPGISPSDVGKKLRADTPQIEAAAARECGRK
jgi:hypothetical protein